MVHVDIIRIIRRLHLNTKSVFIPERNNIYYYRGTRVTGSGAVCVQKENGYKYYVF